MPLPSVVYWLVLPHNTAVVSYAIPFISSQTQAAAAAPQALPVAASAAPPPPVATAVAEVRALLQVGLERVAGAVVGRGCGLGWTRRGAERRRAG